MNSRLDTPGLDRDSVPGAVVVWSGGEPRCAAHRVPAAGIHLDRSLVPWDGIDLDLELTTSGAIRITDRGCALTIDRRPEMGATISNFPSVIRTLGSVLVCVPDVRPFENVTPTRAGTLVIAGSLAPVVRALDEAANAEEHASIRGPSLVTRELATRYAAKLGGYAWFRPSGDQHLDHVLATRPNVRTIIIDLSRPLFELDIVAINRVLETDLRFVVVRTDDHYVQWLPPALAFAPLDVPGFRFDELAFSIHDVIQARNPDGTVELGVIARLLDHGRRSGEDAVFSGLHNALGNCAASGRSELREGDLPRDLS